MLKKVLLLTLAIALLATSFVFADDSQSALSKVTGLTDQDIQSLLQSRIGYGRILTASIVAKMTKTSIKDVLAANQAGTSFSKIAQDNGITLDAYKEAMLKEKAAYIDEQVKAGVITQTQANLIKERMQQGIQACDGQGMGLVQGSCANGARGSGRGFGRNGVRFNNSIVNQ